MGNLTNILNVIVALATRSELIVTIRMSSSSGCMTLFFFWGGGGGEGNDNSPKREKERESSNGTLSQAGVRFDSGESIIWWFSQFQSWNPNHLRDGYRACKAGLLTRMRAFFSFFFLGVWYSFANVGMHNFCYGNDICSLAISRWTMGALRSRTIPSFFFSSFFCTLPRGLRWFNKRRGSGHHRSNSGEFSNAVSCWRENDREPGK